MPEKKYKVGDLVVIRGLQILTGYMHIKDGEMGVIIRLLDSEESAATFFFDYVVLIKGEPIHLFEEEIHKYQAPFNPCPSCECDPCDCGWGS